MARVRFAVAAMEVRSVGSLPSDWEVVRLAGLLREHLPEIRERHGIESVEIFGSYVRNEQRPGSDVDLLVTFTGRPSLFDLIRAEDALSTLLNMPVDLVLRTGLEARFTRYVLREAITL